MKSPCSWRRLIRSWNKFFFTTADTLACDMVRIGYALVVLVMCVTTWSHVGMWYGEKGAVTFDTNRTLIDEDTHTLFEILPRTESTAWIVFGLLTTQAALLLCGVHCRIQAVGVYIVLISLHHRNFLILDAEDAVFRLLGFLLIFLPMGHTLSWDAWRRRRRTRDTVASSCTQSSTSLPCWALRLMQIEMCLIFAGCAYSKLSSDYWLDGRAMYYSTRLDDLFGRMPTPTFLWESLTWMKLICWSVMALEASVPILVWFRETRWVALLLAGMFHLLCDYSMNLYLFHWVMLVGWCSFIRSEEWRWLGTRIRKGCDWHLGAKRASPRELSSPKHDTVEA